MDDPAVRNVVRNLHVLMRKDPHVPADIKSAIDRIPPGINMDTEFIQAIEAKQYEVARHFAEKLHTHTSFDNVYDYIDRDMPFEGLQIAIDALDAGGVDNARARENYKSDLSSLLKSAIVYGRLDTVKYLVDNKGVDPDGSDEGVHHIERAVYQYQTPQGIDVINYLIDKVPPEALGRLNDDEPRTTPLHLVAERPGIPVAIATKMLDRNPGMINNVIRGNGIDRNFTALHLAALKNNVPVVRLLKERGANTQLKTSRGITAYILATDATIKGLLAVGPDPGSPPRAPPPPPPSNPGSASGGRRRTRSKSRRNRTRRRNRI